MVNNKSWYVIKTKSNQEFKAIQNLFNQGFESFCPLIPFVKKFNHKLKRFKKPLFPSYVFSLFDINHDRWTSITNTYGVQYLLKNERMYPQKISEEFIKALKKNCDDNNCITNNYFKFNKNDHVKFTDGPFANGIGRIVELSSSDRVSVLFRIFNNQIKVNVEGSKLLKV